MSLPFILLYALAPRPAGAATLLPLLALVLATVGFRGLIKLRTWGVLALGAALGSATVLAVSPGARTILAAVLLALTLLSELVSFSRIIDAVPPLRAMDRLGRRRPEAEGA